MPLKIVRNDITKMNTQAIVNTANDIVTVGTGCDSAVYNAAGFDELLAYRKENIGNVPEGEVFITPGFNLKAEYIIHAVSPRYVDGDHGVEEKLRSCYRKSLQLAKEHSISSISFPLISTGSFGYPKEEGMRIAVDEINAFLMNNDMLVFIVVFDDKATALGGKLYPDIEEYIDRKYVEERRAEEYSDRYNVESRRNYDRAEKRMDSRDVDKRSDSRDMDKCSNSGTRTGRFWILGNSIQNLSKNSSADKSAPGRSKFLEDTIAQNVMAAEDISADYAEMDFSEDHESKLDERIQHLSDTFSEYLLYMIQEKSMDNVEVYKRAIVDKKTFSKIKNDKNYHPQKLTALCLCVGAKLNLDESRDLLARAGYALSPCDKTDIIFSYFIENEIYDMIELDIQLEEHGLPCIIT